MDNTTEIEAFLAGWHAAQAGLEIDHYESAAWKDGWNLWNEC